MKKLVFPLIAATVVYSSQVVAQTTVATNPVGFISITVQGGTVAQPTINLVSPTLTNPVAFQGTVASVSGTTINITGASFTANQFNGTNGAYYVEVFSGTQAGVLADITATGTSSVTTAQNISAVISAGESIAIRQHITINQFLGANNTFGLLGSNSDATTADNVLVFDGSNQTTYWYYTGTPPSLSDAGWYDVIGNPAGSVTIAPFQGVMIARRGTGNVSIISTGAVKTGNTLFPVVAGPNYIGTVSAQGLTLATSGLYTGNSSGIVGSNSDATTSDQVLLYSGGTSTTYWYYTGTPPSLSDAGWYDVIGNPAGSIALPAGASFIINRIEGGAFNWNLPSPSSF